MNLISTLAGSLVASLVLVACGGSDDDGAPTTKGSFTAVVSFGDSLSDIGTYAPATSLAGTGAPPYFGGKFTTNAIGTGAADANPLGKVWVENLAASLGIAVTPAEAGFNGASVKCPAAAASALASSCTGYGQGGARVSNPAGIGHNADGSGALTVPVVTQIANHLARFKAFKASDLVLVYAGNNDVFLAIEAYGASAATIQAQAKAGTLTPAQASAQLDTAQQLADTTVQQAGKDLAAAVKSQILANGGYYVAVILLNDIGDTPFGNSLPASVHTILTELSKSFNKEVAADLAGSPIRLIDTFAHSKVVFANPAASGFVNNTVPACDGVVISALTGGAVTDGSSLFCNATPGSPVYALRAGASSTTWQFADGVHPTTGGHKVLSDTFAAQLKSFGWI
ncbi:MAG: SGNH/GDSL hydrolase family protein [Caldimonas sp.]